VRALVLAALPHGLVLRVQRRRAERVALPPEEELALRTRRLREAEQRQRHVPSAPWGYEAAIAFLTGRGLPESEVREGSMPEPSLAFCAELLGRELGHGRALVALHVGGFVGVSLACFASVLAELHSVSLVVGIDPNISHRGIQRPSAHALELLRHFGLQERVLFVDGFSLHRNLGNDGFDRYDHQIDPFAELEEVAAPEQVLPRLRMLGEGRFDLAVLDGNHDAEYLRVELEHVAALLRPGGLLVLDDVSRGIWREIRATFESLCDEDDPRFERVGTDGRVGVATRSASGARLSTPPPRAGTSRRP